MFADFGRVAVRGADTARVLLDAPTRSVLDGMALSEDYAITLPTSALPNLARDEALTVDGASYVVREVSQISDGALKRATLRKV
jgi:hypothetical protein